MAPPRLAACFHMRRCVLYLFLEVNRDVNKDLTPKDKDKDLTPKDQDKDKDLKYVLKESLRTRTRTRTTDRQIILMAHFNFSDVQW